MTEKEYIAATNLAKVRIAINALRDTLENYDGVITHEKRVLILRELCEFEEKLYRRIRIRQPKKKEKESEK